jgi:hypothetical protein
MFSGGEESINSAINDHLYVDLTIFPAKVKAIRERTAVYRDQNVAETRVMLLKLNLQPLMCIIPHPIHANQTRNHA